MFADNVYGCAFAMNDRNVREKVDAIKNNALKSFSGLYLLLESESEKRFAMGFPEFLLNSPESACNLLRELLGSSFMFALKVMLKGEELKEAKEFIINVCRSTFSSY